MFNLWFTFFHRSLSLTRLDKLVSRLDVADHNTGPLQNCVPSTPDERVSNISYHPFFHFVKKYRFCKVVSVWMKLILGLKVPIIMS